MGTLWQKLRELLQYLSRFMKTIKQIDNNKRGVRKKSMVMQRTKRSALGSSDSSSLCEIVHIFFHSYIFISGKKVIEVYVC